jgi:small conductance mechanosensitive channel
MNKTCAVSYWLLLPAIALITISNSLFAADCPSDISAVTNVDADVSVEVLSYQVKPLTKCELEVEAQAWLGLLQKKVAEISNAHIAAIYKADEIKAVKEAADALEDVQDAEQDSSSEEKIEAASEAKQALQEVKEAEKKLAQDKTLIKSVEDAISTTGGEGEAVAGAGKSEEEKKDLKSALVKHITVLTADRTMLVDRFNVVLAALAARGGETNEYDAYITAISGLKVDVTDVSATWTTITGWLLSTEGGLRWALNLIKFIVIMVVFYLFSVVAGKAATKAFSRSKHFSTLLREFLVVAARRVILVIGLFVGLSALEVNVGPVLAVIGAAGFVIAFALQNSLSNFASGILMLIYRPFDLGDFVNVAGTQGKVDSMNLLSTQLRMPDNQLVIVPNNSVWGDVIINVTGITRRRIDLVFGIGYSDDIDKAQKILQDIVDGHEDILKEPEAVIRLHELADSSVNFICRPWVKPGDYWDVYWYITREVKRRFDAEGISIPFPQQDVHIYQEALEDKADV